MNLYYKEVSIGIPAMDVKPNVFPLFNGIDVFLWAKVEFSNRPLWNKVLCKSSCINLFAGAQPKVRLNHLSRRMFAYRPIFTGSSGVVL